MRINAFPQIKPSSLFRPKVRKEGHYLPDATCSLFFNGRGALFHGIQSLKLQPGDTVIVPAYHCGVEVETFLKAGLKLLFYDITADMKTPPDFDSLINDKSVKAVFVIHYWGFPQDLAEIAAICNRRKIPLIEDCAHALFSRSNNAPLGTSGTLSIFSLQKTIAVPDGGLLFHRTKNTLAKPACVPPPFISSLKNLLRSTLQGAQSDTNHPLSGIAVFLLLKKNTKELGRFKISNLVPQVNAFANQRYDQKMSIFAQRLFESERPYNIIKKRRSNYLELMQLLSPTGTKPIFQNLGNEICPLFFPVYVKNRDTFEEFLLKHGIETFVFGRTPHPSIKQENFPISHKLSNHVLGIPIHQDLGKDEISFIAKTITQWQAEQKHKTS